MLKKQEFSFEVAGKPFTLTVSKLAEQATSSVVGQYGDTSVLATVVMGKTDREIDYFPLSVDYEERFYAAGKIIGSRFVRREGRPSEEAILSGRLIDRTIRPLFNNKMRRDVQIVITILSYDDENDPDFVALMTASAALAISEIPWDGPVAGVRIAKKKSGELIINPVNEQLANQDEILFEMFVSGVDGKINMIEFSGNESKESDIVEAFEIAQKEIKKMVDFQKDVVKQIGRPKVRVALVEPSDEIKTKVREFLKDKLEAVLYIKDKAEQHQKQHELIEDLRGHLKLHGIEEWFGVELLVDEEIDAIVHKNVLENDRRPDGRKLDEVRSLETEVGLFKRLHGSGLFIRGGTQALAVTTLAAPGSEQLVETMEQSYKKRFMLHYNFPPYSTGEIGRVGAPGRREIGHGALARKAISPMIPSKEEFPYTIRVVSEILASNGSSSMATTCAASMSLMDAGVPLKNAVAGIAMGLMSVHNGPHKVLTDIQGPEDHYGDMDCKIAGTNNGVNAMQMDVKVEGVSIEILKETLEQAKKARLEILEVMNKSIAKPREQVSDFAPVIMTLDINPEKIGEVIGPGGKIINGIIAETGAGTIDIEQTGKVFVAASNHTKAEAAVNIIKSITKEFQINEIVEGPVIKILEFGAIVDLGGGRDGMIHVSELKEGFVKKVEDVVKLGDFVRAKVVKVDNGRIGLSIKALGK
ncbi:polyribonucleotide nucleotidyltransferase [Candidatus Wolfebacteria bacterium]|nr:polyribonucleotide nucleotidyltransferase [Candidatus Wolfebacteria bacterium]